VSLGIGKIPIVSRTGSFAPDAFRPNGATIMLRKVSRASIHRGERPIMRSAACRASSARPSTSRLKASTNWAPAKSWPESTVGGTSRTFMGHQPACQQPKAQDQKDCIDRGPAGQSDPDPDSAELRRECEGVGAG